jgi:hypothetical protein
MKMIKDAEKKEVEERQVNNPSMGENERTNPREEPAPGSKRTLQPVDLPNLTEPGSDEEN